jgi:hypothetical protein
MSSNQDNSPMGTNPNGINNASIDEQDLPARRFLSSRTPAKTPTNTSIPSA